MDITYSYVAERDIDLLVLEEFLANKDFAKIFLNKVGISNYKIVTTPQQGFLFYMGGFIKNIQSNRHFCYIFLTHLKSQANSFEFQSKKCY